jgi:hypothetical protein
MARTWPAVSACSRCSSARRGHLLGGAGCSQLLGAAAAGPRNQQDDQRDTAAGDDSGRSRHKAGRDEWVQVIKLGEERG